MGKGNKIQKPKKSKLISKPKIESNSQKYNLLISLEHLDKKQSESFEDWEKEGKLSCLLQTLHGYSDKKISTCQSKKFTIYGDFPPDHKTYFKYPDYIQQDANWARIHIDGKRCLIGHIIESIFYIVFLDGKHEFWISEKKHT